VAGSIKAGGEQALRANKVAVLMPLAKPVFLSSYAIWAYAVEKKSYLRGKIFLPTLTGLHGDLL
jgi:hypothetical protein